MAKEPGSLSISEVYSKEARRRRRIVFLLSLLVLYAALLGGAWVIVYSPLFRIQHIEIEGNKKVSNEDILTLLRANRSRDSFLKRMLGFENMLAWPGAVSGDILKFSPGLKLLSIQKNYRARSVTVRAEERQPFGVWCIHGSQINADMTQINADKTQINADNKAQTNSDSISVNPPSNPRESAQGCFWFDDEGTLFERSLGVEGSLINVVDDYSQSNLGLNSRILPQEFIQNIFSVFRALSASGISAKEIRLNDLNLQEIEVDTYDGSSAGVSANAGPKFYFSLRFSSNNAAAVIKLLMARPDFKNFQYVDFRVESRAYYK